MRPPNIGDGVRVESDVFAALREGIDEVLSDGVQVSDASAEPGFGQGHGTSFAVLQHPLTVLS